MRRAQSRARGPTVWTAARASSSGACPGSATSLAQASVERCCAVDAGSGVTPSGAGSIGAFGAASCVAPRGATYAVGSGDPWGLGCWLAGASGMGPLLASAGSAGAGSAVASAAAGLGAVFRGARLRGVALAGGIPSAVGCAGVGSTLLVAGSAAFAALRGRVVLALGVGVPAKDSSPVAASVDSSPVLSDGFALPVTDGGWNVIAGGDVERDPRSAGGCSGALNDARGLRERVGRSASCGGGVSSMTSEPSPAWPISPVWARRASAFA